MTEKNKISLAIIVTANVMTFTVMGLRPEPDEHVNHLASNGELVISPELSAVQSAYQHSKMDEYEKEKAMNERAVEMFGHLQFSE